MAPARSLVRVRISTVLIALAWVCLLSEYWPWMLEWALAPPLRSTAAWFLLSVVNLGLLWGLLGSFGALIVFVWRFRVPQARLQSALEVALGLVAVLLMPLY